MIEISGRSTAEKLPEGYFVAPQDLTEAWLLERLNAAVRCIGGRRQYFESISYSQITKETGIPSYIARHVHDLLTVEDLLKDRRTVTAADLDNLYGPKFALGMRHVAQILSLNEFAVRRFMLTVSGQRLSALLDAVDTLMDSQAHAIANMRLWRLNHFSSNLLASASIADPVRLAWASDSDFNAYAKGYGQAVWAAWAIAPQIYKPYLGVSELEYHNAAPLPRPEQHADEIERDLAFSWRILTGEELN